MERIEVKKPGQVGMKRAYEKMKKHLTEEQRHLFNPVKMEDRLIQEAKIYLEEMKDIPARKKVGGLSEAERKRLENGIYFVGFIRQKNDPPVIVYTLAGNPLIIALYLKQYEEAEQILEKMPWTVHIAHAVMAREEYPCGATHSTPGYYYKTSIDLWETVLMDPEIPDGLFLSITRSLLEMYEEIPAIFHYTKRGFPLIEHIFPKPEETSYTEEMKEEIEIQKNMHAYRSLLLIPDSFYRLKNLDPDIFEKYMNEKAAAYIYVMIMQAFFMAQDTRGRLDPEISKYEQLKKLRSSFLKLGFENISVEHIWVVLLRFDRSVKTSTVTIKCAYSVFYKYWKAIVEQGLVLRPSENEEEGGSLLASLFCIDPERIETGRYHTIPKDFAELVDRVDWNSRRHLEKTRKKIEETVIETGDKEFLLMCLEKNRFPMWDMEYLIDLLRKGYSEMIPLVVLKKHNYM